MARLPQPGGDAGNWGNVLNDFLDVEHNPDGTLKATGSLAAKADDSTVVHTSGSETIAGTKTFNASPIVPTPTQTSHATTKAYVDSTVAAGAPDASSTTKGIVQLTGDLSGTATSPTVPALGNKADKTTTVTAGTGLTGGGDLSANRTLAVSYGTTAGTVAQGNDTRIVGAIPSSTATAKGDILAATAPSTINRVGIGSDGQVLTADSTQTVGVKWTAVPSAPVSSVFGRTGVVIAQSGDYTANQVGALPSTDDLSAIATANATAGNVSMNSHKITNLANGTASTDAATFGQIPVAGTTTGTYAAGNDTRITGALQASNNLSDVSSTTTALSNLGAASALTATSVKTTTYTAIANQLIPCDATSGTFTVTLPTAPADKTRVIVKKIDSSTNAVSVATGGGDVYNKTGGATTATLSLLSQAITVQYASSSGIWYVSADDLPLSQLDARYVATGALAINVKDYGAKGDGSTNDTNAIQSAINAIPSSGGTVFFPAGKYLVNSTLVVNSYTLLEGAGRNATQLFKTANVPLVSISGTAGNNVQKSGIIHMTLSGNALTGSLLQLHFAQVLFFSDCNFDGSNDVALDIQATQDSYFLQCTANTNHSTTNPVILIQGASGWSSNMIWFVQCRIEDFWLGAVKIVQGSGYSGVNNGFFFTECKFESTNVGGDIFVTDANVVQLSFSQCFFSATGFMSSYSTKINAINSSAYQQVAFRDIYFNSTSTYANSLLKITAQYGQVALDNLYFNGTAAISTVIFNGFSGASFDIGQVGTDGTAPAFSGTGAWTQNLIPIQTMITGGLATQYVAKTANYTATPGDSIIDCTANTFTITLPTAASIAGRQFTIFNSGTGTITVATTSSQTINGATTQVLSAQYSSLIVESDGVNWKAITSSSGSGGTPSGSAGGDLSGTYPNPTVNLGNAHVWTANQTAPALIASGLTGATAASRYVGATTSGAPISGTFAVGDYIIDQTGVLWICTAAGTPGTWAQGSGGASGAASGDLSGTYPSPSVVSTHLAAPLPIAQGGTGSATQNFLDLSTAQTTTGVKTFLPTNTASSGTDYGLKITPSYSQTNTASATDLLVSRSVTTTGSGTQRLLDLQVGGLSKLNVDALSYRLTTAGDVVLSSGVLYTAFIQITGGGGWIQPQSTNTNDIGTSSLRFRTVWVDGISTNITAKTGAYTAANTDGVITANATTGAFTLTLPTAVGITGRQYTFKKTDSSANAVTIATTSSQTIDGVTTYSLSVQYKYVTVISDGSNWQIIANN